MKTVAFTMAKNEAKYLPIWVRYYSQHFDDLLVLDHGSTDDSLEQASREGDFRVERLDYPIFNDFQWYTQTIISTQRILLRDHDVVLFAEPDEMLWHPEGLKNYTNHLPAPRVTASGYEICQMPGELRIEWSRPILSQRSWCMKNSRYFDKTLLCSEPTLWANGFHYVISDSDRDPELLLMHLHYIDRQYAIDRGQEKKKWNWSKHAIMEGMGSHILDIETMNKLMDYMESQAIEIPEKIKQANSF